MRALFNFVAAKFFAKETEANPARIPPQTPPAGGKRAEAKRKILSPRKIDFRFAESVLKPHALPSKYSGSAWGFNADEAKRKSFFLGKGFFALPRLIFFGGSSDFDSARRKGSGE